MPKNYAYLRVSDKNRQDHETQRDSITRYANENGIIIDSWTEESISGSKTNLAHRKISSLVGNLEPGDKLICTEISRLGRDKPFSILGLINDISEIHEAELHLTYTEQVISKDNVENPEIIFGVVGASYAARQEAIKRSERAKAACNRRVSKGLSNGRQKGLYVKSKLDSKEDYVIRMLNDGTPQTLLALDLNVGRTTLIMWLKNRKIIHEHAKIHKINLSLPISKIKAKLNKIMMNSASEEKKAKV